MKIAADANALLSAVLGGRANLILQHPEVEEILTADETLDEVQEYAVKLARKNDCTKIWCFSPWPPSP